ncbi:alpha/beta hydrolase fold domain-containing protein [Pseudorhodoferax sp. Leaf267]|uniref:alpha/beta hydrolase fold domain-containing protein n=1 Tax=Pseudorhodoferax sp. Leaf267 TaxID=1736316 RepID=UPI0026B9F017
MTRAQAPEHKFPAAWDDALAAYKWALANAASVQGVPKRVALAGESAGGNLAMATAFAARDAGLQQPAHVLAVYPVAQTSLNTSDARVPRGGSCGAEARTPRLTLASGCSRALPPSLERRQAGRRLRRSGSQTAAQAA